MKQYKNKAAQTKEPFRQQETVENTSATPPLKEKDATAWPGRKKHDLWRKMKHEVTGNGYHCQ